MRLMVVLLPLGTTRSRAKAGPTSTPSGLTGWPQRVSLLASRSSFARAQASNFRWNSCLGGGGAGSGSGSGGGGWAPAGGAGDAGGGGGGSGGGGGGGLAPAADAPVSPPAPAVT